MLAQSNVRNYYQQFLDNHMAAMMPGGMPPPGMPFPGHPGAHPYPPRFPLDASQGMRPMGPPGALQLRVSPATVPHAR